MWMLFLAMITMTAVCEDEDVSEGCDHAVTMRHRWAAVGWGDRGHHQSLINESIYLFWCTIPHNNPSKNYNKNFLNMCWAALQEKHSDDLTTDKPKARRSSGAGCRCGGWRTLRLLQTAGDCGLNLAWLLLDVVMNTVVERGEHEKPEYPCDLYI